ncbi:MAG TPA: hypothetical protein VFV90_05440, partial [Usitatibacter sp.]|nr:hypothetical protein [Usitatibacter sp.]
MKIAPRCLLATLLLGTASLALAESIGHAVMPANKGSVVTTFRAPGATPHEVRLGAVEPGALERLKAANAHNDSKRLEVGIGRDVPGLASAAWTATAGGSVARWHVSSQGAESMRVALRAPSWPREAELRFAGSGDGIIYGPFAG